MFFFFSNFSEKKKTLFQNLSEWVTPKLFPGKKKNRTFVIIYLVFLLCSSWESVKKATTKNWLELNEYVLKLLKYNKSRIFPTFLYEKSRCHRINFYVCFFFRYPARMTIFCNKTWILYCEFEVLFFVLSRILQYHCYSVQKMLVLSHNVF